ncbi:MAG: ATP-binding protein [Lacibacter sp.]
MKVKTKLLLSTGILFAMIVLLTVLSTVYINRLSNDTANILVANYNTLDYSRQMIIALDNNIAGTANRQQFEKNLLLQQKNITEPGEQSLTDSLEKNYQTLLLHPSDSSVLHKARKNVSDIMLLNMQAIQRKSKIAAATSGSSVFWISVIGTICFVIALTMFFNLPGNVANPIRELTESIKEIARRNYSRRIQFSGNNEFGELASSFNTMAGKLEEYQASNVQKLLIEKKRIETLINNMNDPVIGLDENRTILFMNNTALKISGLNADETMNKPVQEIAVTNDLIRSLVQDLFTVNKENTESKQPVKIYADNKESYFEKYIIPIKIIPTGETQEMLMGTVILLQNITPYKELDFAKTNFIATVSHELKTPISSIKMSLQLLENKQLGSLNTEQQNLVEGIKEDVGRLLKITGELLNMTQVETGSIQLSVTASSPQDIIEYAVSANRSAAENKNIQLQTSIPGNIPGVSADKDKTAWVLTNLISNAIRFSYDNTSVFITVTAVKDKMKFTVTDNGQGIAPQYINKIFDRYFRIPGTKKEGTGLGLSISKEFIEAQGGYMTVESEFGKGSSFSFYLDIIHE